jgi:hypothetical protein
MASKNILLQEIQNMERRIDRCNHTVKNLNSRVLEKVGSSSCTTVSTDSNQNCNLLFVPLAGKQKHPEGRTGRNKPDTSQVHC